jgi:thioredoxin
MNIFRLYDLLALLVVVAGISGCTDGGSIAFRKESQAEFPGLVAEASSIQQTALNAIVDEPAPTTLVSQATPPEPVGPSLITLAAYDDLEDKIDGVSGAVILDFFADWCGPCRTQSKILHDLEDTAAKTETLIIKINVDDHPKLAKKFGVSSLPTLMMVKDGEIIERQTGVANKNRLASWMQ